MIQFTFHERGMDHPERPRRRAAFLIRCWFKLRKAKFPGRFRRDGGDFGPLRSSGEAHRIIRTWTKLATVGARLDFFDGEDAADQMRFHFRAVEVAPPIPAPETAPPLGPLYVRVMLKHGWATNLGNWFCRYIAGTNTVSRHGYYGSYWKGAAQDFGADNAGQLDFLAEEIVGWTTDPSDDFYGKVATVIVHNRIWQRETGRWLPYGGIFHFHVHVDVDEGVACNP